MRDRSRPDGERHPQPQARVAGAHGHSRPRKHRPWVLPAVLVLVVVIAASGAFAVSRHGKKAATKQVSSTATSATDRGTKAKPQSAALVAEKTLHARIPASFASTCASAPANPAVVGAGAHISCTEDHLDVDFYLFAARPALDSYWRTARAAKRGTAGTCHDDMQAVVENYYQGNKAHLAGQLLCYHGRQSAHIQWAQPDQLIVATAAFSGNNKGMAHGHLVQEWRRDDLGPRQQSTRAVVRHPCGDQDCLGS